MLLQFRCSGDEFCNSFFSTELWKTGIKWSSKIFVDLKQFLLGHTSLHYFHFQWFKQQCLNYKSVAFCFGIHPNQWVPSAKRSRESRFLLKTFFQMKVLCCQWKKLKVDLPANYLLQFGCTRRLHTYFQSFLASKTWKTSCFQPIGRFLMSTVM